MRAFRLASWLLIVPILSLFSFSVVAGARGFGARPDYAGAASAVTPSAHGKDGAVVVVGTSDRNDNPIAKLFSGTTREVCWITSPQLARVAARYRTGRMTVAAGGKTLDLVTVDGAKDRDLRALLGVGALTCRLVQVSSTFFLPFDAHGS
jgi:hypothetical protein